MTATFTIDASCLEAMLAFTSTNRNFNAHSILWDVLVEVSPEAVRLVSTDTHTLGLLHLTPILGHHLDIACAEPTSLVLPLAQMTPVLKEKKFPVTVTLDDEQVTITAASGLSLTLPGRLASEFPQYQRVLALDTPITPTARMAYDLSLLAKFAAFAKTMGVAPNIDLAFHGTNSPASIRIGNLTGFYGIAMPRTLGFEDPIPSWLQPPQPEAEETRVIRLHDVEGIAKLAGVDDDGLHWVQFEVDEFAGQEPGICGICGAALQSGWLCGDGGEEVCDRHIQLIANDTSDVDASGDVAQCVLAPLPVEDAPIAIPA
ncbi:MAG: hypothetical protein BWY76_00801 [bacterium ADurb.Bin429]|nr:MAG: hypothetical protein BWY76_00801 [bacterium ADurb.Bin429]